MAALVNGLSIDELTEPGTIADQLLGESVDALMQSRLNPGQAILKLFRSGPGRARSRACH